MPERPRILVVDDEESARETLEALLHADRYHLLFAVDGADALAKLEEHPVDLVICDVMMPGIEGYEVCRRLKAHSKWQFIPIILVTALDGQDDMVRGLEVGADDFLTKPVQRVVLRARVRALLRVRNLYRKLEASGAPIDLEALVQARKEKIADEASLSAREREVLDLLLLGRAHDEIGKALGISVRTAKYHQAKILDKVGADSRVDLIRIFL